jgi:RimJ/RimL family protein N-acetyltransferase
MARLSRSDLPIVTRRLLLRDFEAGDLAPLERVAADRRVAGHLPAHSRALALLAESSSAGRRRSPRQRRAFDLAVVTRRRSRVIGACDLALTGRGRADFGYVLAPRHWGFGYGTEVATALVDFAFGVLKLRELFAVVAVENERSRRVLDKAGLRWDGLMRRHARFAGRWWDCHRYVIDRAGWQAARAACADRARVGS